MASSRRTTALLAGLTLPILLAAGSAHAAAGDSDNQRAERWGEIKQQIFGDAKIQSGGKAVRIDAPKRADDASLVPITLTVRVLISRRVRCADCSARRPAGATSAP
ncbi:thiosulfate oxidation carrier protein SoxY [Methylorubrum extorquens]|uniref:thiosulfate oxidation carrier protein SoxY n=1 Tax=Methylorubrum extorquens TaxID=408 RepID=UPI0002D6A023|nr:thiosulfate oxidation carrier protein SoxY [Methylorubrum extorquens]